MAEKRINIVLAHIRQNKQVTLRELCGLFPDYNEMTLRRDLIVLEKNGYVRRVRGGAVINDEMLSERFSYELRQVAALEQKRKIAVCAVGMLNEGDSIYLDAGTTTLEMARLIPDMPLFVTTNGPTIAFELKDREQVDVILTGGSLNKSVMSVSGPIALNALDTVNVDTVFVGAAGISATHGLTNALYNECELKRKAIASGKKVVALIDSKKHNVIRPYTFAELDGIDILITDAPLPPELSRAAADAGVEVLGTQGKAPATRAEQPEDRD